MYSLNENFLSGLAVLPPNYRPSNKNPNKRYKKLKSPLQIKVVQEIPKTLCAISIALGCSPHP